MGDCWVSTSFAPDLAAAMGVRSELRTTPHAKASQVIRNSALTPIAAGPTRTRLLPKLQPGGCQPHQSHLYLVGRRFGQVP